jgi:hypothetical protein
VTAMNSLHATLAIVAAVGIALFAVAALLTAVGTLRSRVWLDRALIVQGSSAVAAGLTGLATFGTRPPSDGLHLLYGALIVVGPLAARALAHGQETRRLGRSLTLVALVVVGILVRAFMTGD